MSFRIGEAGPPGKPALLFLSPIMPAVGGNGLAMRAGATLEALAADYTVHLLVIPVAGPAGPAGEDIRRWSARILSCIRRTGTSTRCSS